MLKNKLKEKVKKTPVWLQILVTSAYREVKYIQGLPKIKKDLMKYESLNKRKNFVYKKKYRWFIDESVEAAGTTSSYYWQDLWAAAKIIENRPKVHYDIGSRIDGFIAHLQASKIQTNLIDIRPLNNTLPYVGFTQADATSLKGIPDNSISSISALCSLEHFGLGRYGDPIDPEACFKAFQSIQRVLEGGGYCYISVPIGREHVEFNAHRIFYAQTIIDAFSECELVEFFCNTLEREMKLVRVKDIHQFDKEADNRGCRFGLFMFMKK